MSIYRRFPSRGQPSFITTNVLERRKLFSSSEACELLLKTVNQVRVELSFKLLAFAIMPDHLHLIVVPPEDGPAKMMQLIKGRFSRTYGGLTACAEPVWQSRYHERILTTEQALFSAIEYVHNNPVASRLVGQPEDYRWSSAGAEWKTDLEQFFRSG